LDLIGLVWAFKQTFDPSLKLEKITIKTLKFQDYLESCIIKPSKIGFLGQDSRDFKFGPSI